MRRINWCKKPETDLKRARICWEARGRSAVKDDKLAELAALSVFLIRIQAQGLEKKLTDAVKPEYATLWPQLRDDALGSALYRAVEHGYLRVEIEDGMAVYGTVKGTNAVIARLVNAKINWKAA